MIFPRTHPADRPALPSSDSERAVRGLGGAPADPDLRLADHLDRGYLKAYRLYAVAHISTPKLASYPSRLESMCGLDLVTPDMRGVPVGPEGQIRPLVAEANDVRAHAAGPYTT